LSLSSGRERRSTSPSQLRERGIELIENLKKVRSFSIGVLIAFACAVTAPSGGSATKQLSRLIVGSSVMVETVGQESVSLEVEFEQADLHALPSVRVLRQDEGLECSIVSVNVLYARCETQEHASVIEGYSVKLAAVHYEDAEAHPRSCRVAVIAPHSSEKAEVELISNP